MASSPKSCDTFVALPSATGNGCMIFGKNSDRPGNEVQEVVYLAAASHKPGDKLQCTYIDIPQVEKTYAVVLSKPSWMWGAEMGANEQRGGSARESLDVITACLESHGQGGPCAEGGDWFYHNSFIIADGNEAWGVRNISNQLTIGKKFDLSSAGLIEAATEAGIYKPSDGEFNFARVFDDDSLSTLHSRYCNGKRLLKKYSENGQFNVSNMMSILRDTDSGINQESGTCASQVSMLPSNQGATAASTPACHWFTATPDPAISMFKPFIFTPNVSIGELTLSPQYGLADPARIKPRFSSKVERRHQLYKAHEKLIQMKAADERKVNGIIQNVRELENNCIADMEEILRTYGESSGPKDRPIQFLRVLNKVILRDRLEVRGTRHDGHIHVPLVMTLEVGDNQLLLQTALQTSVLPSLIPRACGDTREEIVYASVS
ncbi:SCRN2-like protein [Mya arenaria]|uniref:SCRN2-like protein n=1 Tax=Mya arenaria TaxID=6604 RepID=A0ABY7DA61_MYAAR|nr:SCRN2-like protein [Mya arenaria]